MMVYLVVFDKTAYRLSDKLFKSIKAYIDENYVEARHNPPTSPPAPILRCCASLVTLLSMNCSSLMPL